MKGPVSATGCRDEARRGSAAPRQGLTAGLSTVMPAAREAR